MARIYYYVIKRSSWWFETLRHSTIDSLLNPSISTTTFNQESSSTQSKSRTFASSNDRYSNTQAGVQSLKLTIEELKQPLLTQGANIKSLQAMNEENSADDWQSDPHAQSKLGHTGVSYRQFYFKDPAHLEAWIKTHMSHPSHGLFVDLVSFSEFFGGERYIERNTTFRFIFVCQLYNILHTYFSILNRNFKKQIPYIVCPTALRNDDVTTTAGMHITTRSIVVVRLHCFIHDTKAIS